MEKANIIREGNKRMLILPDDFCPDCDELNIDCSDSEISITRPPKKATFADFLELMSGFTEDVADAIIEARQNDFPQEREEL